MEEKEHIGQLFDGISGTYDKLNHLLSLNIDKLWRRKAVRLLKPAANLLDVAIGTADLSIEILRQGKARNITGIDLSRNMMEIGMKKVQSKGIDAQQIKFLEASALEMPFTDNSFDALTCAYGVRNFSDLDKGLCEMYRVLHVDGQLMILEFSYPGNRVVRALYDFFFSKIMPLIGRIVSHDPKAYTYFRNSVKNFIWGEAMVERIKSAGFRDVSYKPLTLGITTIYFARK